MKNLLLLMAVFLSTSPLFSQTVYQNYNADYATFLNKNVELQGKGLLTITGAEDPISGSTINLTSEDAWVYFPHLRPSQVLDNELSHIQINGAAATHGSNCRIAIYTEGAMVIPHSSTFNALTVYADDNLSGTSASVQIDTHYKSAELGTMDNNVQSFRLKKGYMATFASNEDGTGNSRVYIASEGDIVVSAMPTGLSNTVSMIVVRPWNWVAKKSWRGGVDGTSGAKRFGATSRYDYNNDGSSTINIEYIPMRHNKYWNSYENFYAKYDCTHALFFNEPNNPVDDGYADVATAIAQWPEMMASGLRLGSPAVTDGGLSWLYDFIDQCDALGYRVDFIAWHFYRAFQSADQLYNALAAIHQRTGRPIWITEMNNGCNWTYQNWVPSLEENRAKIQSWIDRLETAPFVERYMVWDGCNETLRMTNSSTGELYPAGEAYKNEVSTLAYRSDYYNNDLGASDVAGTVKIKNRRTGMYLNSGGSTSNGAPIVQYATSSDNNSKWELVPVSNSNGAIYYYIKNVATGLLIDGYGRTTNGSELAMNANSSTDVNAQWKFEAYEGNNYRIKNRGTGMYIDGYGYTSNGAICNQYYNLGDPNGQWEIISEDAKYSLEGTYQIQNRGTGMFVDGFGATSNGDAARQWANTTSSNAKWEIIATGDYYQIKNVATGMVLDGYGRTANGSAVSQYASYTTHDNSKWVFMPVIGTDGITYYYIQNVGTGLKMDGYGRTGNGDELAQYSNTTTHVNSQWKLIQTLKSAQLETEPIEEVNSLKLYPNPAQTKLNIELANGYETCKVTVYNSSGQIMLSVPDCTGSIDVSSLKSDIYFIKILTETNTIVSKFAKQ